MSTGNGKKIDTSERVWQLTVIIGGALFLHCILTFLITPLFMTHPNTDIEAAAELEENAEIQKISINGTNTLSGYLLDDPDSETLIIYFYGISDDAASSMKRFIDIRNSPDHSGTAVYDDFDIAVVDWPAYGESSGSANDSSMKQAAADTVTAFSETGDGASSKEDQSLYSSSAYTCSRIVIIGYSLGTGPAIYAASVCGCDDLILLSPYYSTVDLYNNITPVFYGPFEGLAGFRIDTYEYAKKVSVSPLIIASENDCRVPYDSTVRLSECFPRGCNFESFPILSHGDIPTDPGVLELIRQRLTQKSDQGF